mmetsp:Transcript_33271/g.50182  ORF Transcript_33271/g.50182 Transcript_33271/m.50182 type:complete len:271 (-) Transcript_33271:1285-2097(-)
MKFHIEKSEKQLSACHHTSSVSLLLLELLKHLLWKCFTCLVVLCESVNSLFVVTKVLHELRWKLYCIPLNSVDSCNISNSNSGQHVLQSVSSLVEKCLNLSESHERWLSINWWRSITRQVCNWNVSPHSLRLSNANIHPCTSSLVSWTGKWIKVEACNVLSRVLIVNVEERNIVIPNLGLSVSSSYFNVENTLQQSKHTIQNIIKCEVWTKLFLLHVELVLLKTLTPESCVPRHEFLQIFFGIFISSILTCICGNFSKLTLRSRKRFLEN